MATAPGLPRVPKSKPSLPSHYYEGFLEKKGPKDRDYKKFWAGLQGLTIFLYNSNREPQYVEKVDLSNFLALTDEPPKGSCTKDPGTHFCLSLEGQEIRFKVDSLESREMWKGFIMTVVELKVPSNLTLLPGHKYMMAEALTKEKDRRAQEKPSCFLNVSRVEAQLLLEKYPDCGNMILRPGSDRSGGFSITTLQTLNGAEVVRHYKVKRESLGYVIDVEEPVSCCSLHDVVNYFVSSTKGALVPFYPDEDYEKVLGFVEANQENGENTWTVPKPPAPWVPGTSHPLGPSLSGGEAQQIQQLPGPGKPPWLPTPLPPVPAQDENYIIPISDEPTTQYVNEDEMAQLCRLKAPALPQRLLAAPKAKKPGKPLPRVPPVPNKTKTEPRGLCGPRKAAPGSSQPKVPFGLSISTDITEELERKLQQRRANLEK
ncbi:signal-transducing adaptor protein 2 isoform X1 [Antechinus flavipes]|uniref:signal-transducing adaptor protein 2 isoform X1 n=1 Tax=Antechinus flavipes TaxID=38775 RepID=UPI00223567D3|nr:signal-transducing adaptor protein 2 isoform X1 [Antechinus flavipes]